MFWAAVAAGSALRDGLAGVDLSSTSYDVYVEDLPITAGVQNLDPRLKRTNKEVKEKQGPLNSRRTLYELLIQLD